MLTRSPATIASPAVPTVTAASPVRTPARSGGGPSRSGQLRDRVDELERGPDRLLGVVLAGDRCAPDRHDRVADELLDGAAVPLDDRPGEGEVGIEERPRLLRVADLGRRREPDEVGEQDADQPELG